MQKVSANFPFPTSFQFREDERAGLEALFERVFFDRAFESEARKALSRTRFDGRGPGQKGVEREAEAPSSRIQGELVESGRVPHGHGVRGGDPSKAAGDDARYVLLCRGLNGVGKTRIFRHLRESAQGRRIPVYEAHHHEVEGIPFKPFLHTIRKILRDHDPGAVLQKKYRSRLENLIPDVFDHADGPSSGEKSTLQGMSPERFEAQKVRLFDAITQLLLEVTTRKPLLLLVHDLHWSDRSTIELLHYIGRNLQLRNATSSRQPPRELILDSSSGPEVEGFESEEWRTLARQSAQLASYLEASPPRASSQDAVSASGARTGPPPARLLVLANYRGFPDKSHYLEEAITQLGQESFAYHSELRVLNHEEAGRFIQQSIAGVEVGGHPLEIPPDGVDAIYSASEGFPSFIHELFRGLYLHASGARPNGALPWVWNSESVGRLLADSESALEVQDSPETESTVPDAKAKSKDSPTTEVFPPPPDEPRWPLGRRHAILRLRLADATAAERRVLEVMAVARRPVTVPHVVTALQEERKQLVEAGEPGDDSAQEAGSGDEGAAAQSIVEQAVGLDAAALEDVFRGLEERGLVERCVIGPRPTSQDGAEEEGYFFRLWDYTRVVEEGLDGDQKKQLHQRLGEDLRGQIDSRSDESAYEVFYHLYRGVDPRSALEYGRLASHRFWRSFALEKARRVENCLVGLLTRGDDVLRRVHFLEETARISLALRDVDAAEKALRRVQEEGASILSPERRLELLFLEAEATATADPGRALKILGRAPKLLAEENTRLGARLQLVTARVRLLRQDVKRAINFCLKGVRICQKIGSVPELGELYRVLGNAFYQKGDYSHAVDNYQRALTAFEELGLEEATVGTLDELGRVYLERGLYFPAARYLYKSLEIRRRLNDVAGLCKSYDQLALAYLRSGDDFKTIENLNRTLALKERIGDFPGLNPTLATLGDLYRRLGSYEQSLHYFRWEVENSQRLGETAGLVEAFAKLGRVYFDLGDLRQAEGLCKQVSILASEFKLRSQEADGAVLDGHLKAFERQWNEAEKSFKLATEVHGKLGHRRREASALLDFAEVKFARELYDESLKLTSKGHIVADEIKAVDLQVRALTLKGNIHRFLKGGNAEKAAEAFHKALDLSQALSDAQLLFDLFYSLAKTCHSQREFAEAANYYGKAELILKKIGDDLSDDLAARFFEDRRRKVFAEDIDRFRKETLSRNGAGTKAPASGVLATSLKDRPSGVADYKDLDGRVLRLHSRLKHVHFHDHLLGEALELTAADRGFILRVQSRQYLPVAFQGFGKNPAQHPEYMAASHIAQDAIRRGHSVRAGGEGDRPELRQGKHMPLGGLMHRSILCVPFMTDERIFGGVYLDRSIALGQFGARDQVLLEAYAEHCAVSLNNRREFETVIREPLTGLYTPSYFVDRLRESYRWFNLHGKAFAVIAAYLPTLEETIRDGRGHLGGRLAQELAEVLPFGATMCWGDPLLYALLEEGDAPLAEQISRRLQERLGTLLEVDVPTTVLPAEAHYQQGAEIYSEARRRLLPEEFDRGSMDELTGILAADISLRDAKKTLERYKIEMTLRKTGGNITHAAKELGIHRPQLSNLLKKHGLKRELFDSELAKESPDDEETPGESS